MIPETSNYNIKYYIDECRKRSEYHKTNADNALSWHNFFTIISVAITGLQALCFTVFGVYGVDEKATAITGGVFALFLALFTKIQTSFNYNVLAVQHNVSADDFNELVQHFSLMDQGSYDFRTLVLRFVSVIEKSHLQPVCSPFKSVSCGCC